MTEPPESSFAVRRHRDRGVLAVSGHAADTAVSTPAKPLLSKPTSGGFFFARASS
jgi:hypothetical protein